MQVFHTAGVPPRSGNTIFAIIGCTRNSSDELRNSVSARTMIMGGRVWIERQAGCRPERRAGLSARACGVSILAGEVTKKVQLKAPYYCDTVTDGLLAVIVKLLFRNNLNSYAPGVVGIVTVHVRVVTAWPTHV